MVVPSLHRGSTCENDVSTSLSTVNGALARRTSSRLQKLQIQKTLKISYKEDELDDVEEKVIRKKAKVREQKKNQNPKGKCMLWSDDGVHDVAMDASLTEVPEPSANGDKSAYAMVTETLRKFSKRHLQCVQEEERRAQQAEACQKKAKGSNSKKGNAPDKNISKRPDLKAIKQMRQTNDLLTRKKQIGSFPGVDVGFQFFSRAEMAVIGFHSHWLSGIDYIGESAKKDYPDYTLPIATVIVISGQYEDDLDNCDDVVYTGQGGNDLLGGKHQIKDQVMRSGNLGLKNCMEQSVPIRVVRGHKSESSYVGKVYTYDGLYEVVSYWAEKGISGFTVYKFRLQRRPGQPLLTTSQVQFTRGQIPKSISEIRGLVCEDISGGQEEFPIPATNLVDDPPVAPTDYKYFKSLQLAKGLRLPKATAPGCGCKGACTDPNRCACARLNGKDFPYVYMQRGGGRLVEPKDVVFECGPNCGCGPECVNRTSQRGIKFRLEVFRTPNKGWGVRSWDPIPSGSPVCEYIGILRRTEDLDPDVENYYVFDIDCLQTMKGLEGRQRRQGDVSIPAYMGETSDDNSETESFEPEFCIDACSSGNVTRYINHSCSPNLFVQCVLSSHHDMKLARIVLFAADNIPPLQELSYDYAYAVDSVVGPDGKKRQIVCYCGAPDCRKRLL